MEKLRKLVNWLTNRKTGVGILIVVSLVAIGTPIAMYLAYIGTKITSQADRWGQFGDYMGGTLNPILSLLTLLVTIYIAFILAKLDNERGEEAIQFEKRRFLNEMRENEYRKVTTSLNKISHVVGDGSVINPQAARVTFYQVIIDYDLFLTTNEHLFPFLNESVCSNLKASLNGLLSVVQRDTYTTNDLIPAYRSYGESRGPFIKQIREFILDEM